MAQKGITFNKKGEVPPDVPRKDIGVGMTLTIDDIVLRAVSKTIHTTDRLAEFSFRCEATDLKMWQSAGVAYLRDVRRSVDDSRNRPVLGE
jgi:hypothetical protein